MTDIEGIKGRLSELSFVDIPYLLEGDSGLAAALLEDLEEAFAQAHEIYLQLVSKLPPRPIESAVRTGSFKHLEKQAVVLREVSELLDSVRPALPKLMEIKRILGK